MAKKTTGDGGDRTRRRRAQGLRRTTQMGLDRQRQALGQIDQRIAEVRRQMADSKRHMGRVWLAAGVLLCVMAFCLGGAAS